MQRRLSTILSLTSLALCVMTCALLIYTPFGWPLGCPDWFLAGVFAAGSAPLIVRGRQDKNRRLFTILSTISLILCVLSIHQWTTRGGVILWDRFDRWDWPRIDFHSGPPDHSTTHIRKVSYGMVNFVEVHGCYEYRRTIEIPGWLATGLCAAMPVIWCIVGGISLSCGAFADRAGGDKCAGVLPAMRL